MHTRFGHLTLQIHLSVIEYLRYVKLSNVTSYTLNVVLFLLADRAKC